MLHERHFFVYHASVPFPTTDWKYGINIIECWLNDSVGPHLTKWAWNMSNHPYHIGVGFKWDEDRILFLVKWK